MRRNYSRLAAGMLVTTAAVLIATVPAYSQETREVAAGELKLTVPANWKDVEPPEQARRFRKAQFEVTPAEGEGEPAEMVVYHFGGSGGGARANVTRWMGQFDAEGREAKAVQGKSPKGPYVLVDVSGTYNKPIGPPIQRQTEPTPNSRMLAVVLAVEGEGNYFLKLTGPQDTVGKITDEFRAAFGGDASAEQAFQPQDDS